MYNDDVTKIWYSQDYHKYWIFDEHGEKVINPLHTKILYQFKQNDFHAVEYYFNQLKEDLINFRNNNDVFIIPIPSSNAGIVSPSLISLSEKLSNYNNINYLSDCLQRIIKIPKLASGGDRSKSVHFNSISINNPVRIKGKTILLLDDVTTSGNSLIASKEILINAGAKDVICLALTKTVHD